MKLLPFCLLLAMPTAAWAQLATPRTGYPVTLTSKPAGAQVWLGREKLGTTPWNGHLRAGSCTIELRRKGYAPRSKALVVRRIRGNQRYHAELEATGGILAIRGTEVLVGAQVTVNDEPVGTIEAEGFREPMAPGRYLVRLQKPGYRPAEWWATIRHGQETSRDVSLDPESRVLPLHLPAHCIATLANAEAGDSAEALTALDRDTLDQAAADNRALTLTCDEPETLPPSPESDKTPPTLIIEATAGELHIDGRRHTLPARTTIPAGTTTLRFTVPDLDPRYQPPPRLTPGAYTVAVDSGFPRMLAVGLQVGTGPVFGRPTTLQAGTYLQGNRLAAYGAATWHPLHSGPWTVSVTTGAEAGAAFVSEPAARFAELHTAAEVAATFPRIHLSLGLELEAWADLHCPNPEPCPSMPAALEATGIDPARLRTWQWHARPLLSLTVHITLHGGWALATTVHAAFHPRGTYSGTFGRYLPDDDPLMYMQTGLRRTF